MIKLNHLYKWILLSISIITIITWFLCFPIKMPFKWGDIFFEGMIFLTVLIIFFFITNLPASLLGVGWSIFVYGLLIDLLDEFTKDPDFLNTYIEGMLIILGLSLVTIGFYLSHKKLQTELTKSQLSQKDQKKLIDDLQKALKDVKTLSGLLPICSYCKKIRDDKGYWHQVETYIKNHSQSEFSHGICPECSKKLYPDIHKE